MQDLEIQKQGGKKAERAVILFQSGLEGEEAEQNTVRDAAALLDCERFMYPSCVSEAARGGEG